MNDQNYELRKALTFAQAEGVAPLPTQLCLGEVSQELRALLWGTVYDSMIPETEGSRYSRDLRFNGSWLKILREKHVARDHKMADEFQNIAPLLIDDIKRVFTNGDYVAIFDLLQWLLRRSDCPVRRRSIQKNLEDSRAAYRLLNDGRTFVPVSSDEENDAVTRAFVDVSRSEFSGARVHLQNAAAALMTGKWAESVRESIHSVESVARDITGEKLLSTALSELKKNGRVHPALERGFNALYGYTSDEEGIRHPLLDSSQANVDEADALFMFGACASSVSYLVNKSK